MGARNALGLACRIKHRDRSITCMREGLEIARDHLPGHDYAVAAANLGEILQIDGQFQEAEALLSEALGIFREVRKVHGAVNCLNHIGFCRLQIGDVDGGLARFSEAAAMCRDNNLMTALGTSLAGWVEAKLIAGNVAGAATLCTFVEQLDISVSEAIVEINRIKPLIEQRLKPTELQAARERAADLNFDETVEQLVGLHEPPPDSPTART